MLGASDDSQEVNSGDFECSGAGFDELQGLAGLNASVRRFNIKSMGLQNLQKQGSH